MTFLQFIIASINARRLALFHGFFYWGMFASKAVYPLWFEKHGRLELFAVSYGAMAIVGMFSFLWGHVTDRWGAERCMLIGCSLYAIGMFLRIYPHSVIIAILSGVIAGAGASLTIICLRYWVFAWEAEQERNHVIAANGAITSIGRAVGTASAGWIALSLGVLSLGYPIVLGLAALFPILALLFLPRLTKQMKEQSKKAPSLKNTYKKVLSEHQVLFFGITFFSLLSGAYLGMIVPYLPVLLKSLSLDVAVASSAMAVGSLLSGIVQPMLSSWFSKTNKAILFFISSVIYAGLLCTLSMSISYEVILFVVLFLFVSMGALNFYQRCLEVSILPKEYAGFFYGLATSSFCIGDMIGAGIGSWFYTRSTPLSSLLITGTIVVFHAMLFTLFIARVRKGFSTREVLTTTAEPV